MVPVSSVSCGVPVTVTTSLSSTAIAMTSPILYVPSAVFELTDDTVGGLASKVTVKSPPEAPIFPAASVTRADKTFDPSFPQPEPEFIVIEAEPLEISEVCRTEVTGDENEEPSSKISTVSPASVLVPVKSTTTTTPSDFSDALMPPEAAVELSGFVAAVGALVSTANTVEVCCVAALPATSLTSTLKG